MMKNTDKNTFRNSKTGNNPTETDSNQPSQELFTLDDIRYADEIYWKNEKYVGP